MISAIPPHVSRASSLTKPIMVGTQAAAWPAARNGEPWVGGCSCPLAPSRPTCHGLAARPEPGTHHRHKRSGGDRRGGLRRGRLRHPICRDMSDWVGEWEIS